MLDSSPKSTPPYRDRGFLAKLGLESLDFPSLFKASIKLHFSQYLITLKILLKLLKYELIILPLHFLLIAITYSPLTNQLKLPASINHSLIISCLIVTAVITIAYNHCLLALFSCELYFQKNPNYINRPKLSWLKCLLVLMPIYIRVLLLPWTPVLIISSFLVSKFLIGALIAVALIAALLNGYQYLQYYFLPYELCFADNPIDLIKRAKQLTKRNMLSTIFYTTSIRTTNGLLNMLILYLIFNNLVKSVSGYLAISYMLTYLGNIFLYSMSYSPISNCLLYVARKLSLPNRKPALTKILIVIFAGTMLFQIIGFLWDKLKERESSIVKPIPVYSDLIQRQQIINSMEKSKPSPVQVNIQKTTEQAKPLNSGSVDDYMSSVQSKIKNNWHPPRNKESYTMLAVFEISRSGELITYKLTQPIESNEANQAAVEALLNSAPFEPLPKQLGESARIEFRFDYNAFQKKN